MGFFPDFLEMIDVYHRLWLYWYVREPWHVREMRINCSCLHLIFIGTDIINRYVTTEKQYIKSRKICFSPPLSIADTCTCTCTHIIKYDSFKEWLFIDTRLKAKLFVFILQLVSLLLLSFTKIRINTVICRAKKKIIRKKTR